MEFNWYEIFIQAIGIIGIIAGLSAFQCNKHSHALALKMTEEGAFGLQYFLLGGYTGAVLNLVGIFRNLIFTYLGKRKDYKEYSSESSARSAGISAIESMIHKAKGTLRSAGMDIVEEAENYISANGKPAEMNNIFS